MAEPDSLVSRRSKRSTAGNRMELALAELESLEEPQEPEEDVEFVIDKEEEDVFESDFASTDEEAVQEDVDEGDKGVQEEERRERKTARARIEKATAAAHARQRVTFNPEATSSQPKLKLPSKSKRRVSLGVVVNAETGEVIQGGTGSVGVKRQSQRRHTVMNTSATVNRIKDAEEKRAAIPKKTKTITRLPAQGELIARALDTEEGNITEHKNYLRLEEEKRAKARVVKKIIEGPVLRWISKKETTRVEVQLPPPPPVPPETTGTNLYGAKYSFVITPGANTGMVGSQAYSMPFYAYTPFITQNATPKPQVSAPAMLLGEAPTTSGTNSASVIHIAPSQPSTSPSDPQELTTHNVSATEPAPPAAIQQQQQQQQPQPRPQTRPLLFSYPPASTAPLIVHRTEDVCKNYVIHELSQSIPSKPSWNNTMSAMFGDHVRWDEVKVLTGKGRPLARPVRPCPVTGQPAKYCDPRTNVPFANVGAYGVLTKVLSREYVWCSALGCYVGSNETSPKGSGTGEEANGVGDPNAGRENDTGRDRDESGGGETGTEELEEQITKRRKVGRTNE